MVFLQPHKIESVIGTTLGDMMYMTMMPFGAIHTQEPGRASRTCTSTSEMLIDKEGHLEGAVSELNALQSVRVMVGAVCVPERLAHVEMSPIES